MNILNKLKLNWKLLLSVIVLLIIGIFTFPPIKGEEVRKEESPIFEDSKRRLSEEEIIPFNTESL